jgi:lysophospholipase L1-like esterase
MAGDLVCLGDSITFGSGGLRSEHGPPHGWVALVAKAISDQTGAVASPGFRGTWLEEWGVSGAWQRRSEAIAADGAPFGRVLGPVADRSVATWRTATPVAGAEVIVQGDPAGWEYRVDDGDWLGARFEASGPILASMAVERAIRTALELRPAVGGHELGGRAIVGIVPNAAAAPNATVHNLGLAEGLLSEFCRPTSGDPFALLAHLDAAAVTILFTNDVVFENESKYAARLERLVERLGAGARLLLISAFEQRPARAVSTVTWREGSCALDAGAAGFDAADVGRHVSGEGLAPGTRISAVESSQRVVLDRVAHASGTGIVHVGFRRSAESQAQHRHTAARVARDRGVDHLDLFDLWAEIIGAPGFDAAMRAGLMADALHPSPLGHDVIASAVLDWLTG